MESPNQTAVSGATIPARFQFSIPNLLTYSKQQSLLVRNPNDTNCDLILGARATKTMCPNCKKNMKESWIYLKPPYICVACGYSMWEKRCINYPRDIVIKDPHSNISSQLSEALRQGYMTAICLSNELEDLKRRQSQPAR